MPYPRINTILSTYGPIIKDDGNDIKVDDISVNPTKKAKAMHITWRSSISTRDLIF